MKATIALLVILFTACSPAVAQTQIDAATRQDVEDMLQLPGMRNSMQTMVSVLASHRASSAAERYKQQHPSATPEELQKVATAVAECFQQLFKAIPPDELIDALIPIYQRYLTHSDIKAMNEFYSTPTGQNLLKDSPAMMAEGIQAGHALAEKHLPEIEAQAEKAAQQAAQPTPAQPK